MSFEGNSQASISGRNNRTYLLKRPFDVILAGIDLIISLLLWFVVAVAMRAGTGLVSEESGMVGEEY